ncbi:MFS transporter [Alkaliflexus imshenetskii]|jgi:MFS family permease|uniref:MFS transporter n=1 Tax=Alkaliflexus imshenetskii TaxID=286730 RepID=UPI00047B92A3|nr:MFS transporter [Alkaliflexus imshenetskii]
MKHTLRDSAAVRWLVLVLVSSLMFSTYWFYDFFGGLKGLMNSELGISSEEFGRIIASTTFANVFGMIILGGIILDKWGIRISGLVFGGLAFAGASLSALAVMGVLGDDKSTMLVWSMTGRVLFGIGMEVVCVIVTRAVVKWFMGYELALAMAVNIGFGRLGTALGISISPDIAAGSVAPAVSFAAILIGISILFFIIYLFFDIRLDRQRAGASPETESIAAEEEFHLSDFLKLVTDRSFIFITLLCVAFYSAVFPLLQYTPDLLVNKFGFSYELAAGGEFALMGSVTMGTVFIYVMLFLFGLGFSMVPPSFKRVWSRMLSFALILLVFGFFIYSLKDVFQVWFRNGPKTASLIPMGTILFTPVFGSLVDKRGKSASLMILGSLLLIFANLSLSVFNNVWLGYMGLFSLGIAFSLVPAAMWPAVARIVAESRLGTAYATMFTVQNWGLFTFFWGIGALLDYVNKDNLVEINAGNMSYDYTIPVLMLVLIGIVSIFLAYQLKIADKRQGYGLENPHQKPA